MDSRCNQIGFTKSEIDQRQVSFGRLVEILKDSKIPAWPRRENNQEERLLIIEAIVDGDGFCFWGAGKNEKNEFHPYGMWSFCEDNTLATQYWYHPIDLVIEEVTKVNSEYITRRLT